MEFWGVEVKSGVPLSVEPGENKLVHISQAALGKNEKNENVSVRLYLSYGGKKLIIGTLSHEKFPQLSTEIVVEKGFQLSHSWENGSVYFTGYRVDGPEPCVEDMSDDKPAPVAATTGSMRQVNFQLPAEDVKAKQDAVVELSDEDESSEEDDSSSEDDEAEEDEEVKVVTTEADNGAAAEDDSSDDDEDDSSDDDEDDSDEDDSSEEEETPKKVASPKKRSAEASTSKKAVSNKKAKFVTPQKSTESKKPHVHVATPHPSKGGKNSGSNGEASKQTPKSAGAFGCKSCNRSFTSEMGLQSHTKAKHSAAA